MHLQTYTSRGGGFHPRAQEHAHALTYRCMYFTRLIYVHTYIYTYIHTYIHHTYIRTYVHIYMSTLSTEHA